MNFQFQFLASLIMSGTTVLFRIQVLGVEQALFSTAMTTVLRTAKAANILIGKTLRSFR